MSTPSGERLEPGRRWRVPRWLVAWLLFAGLSSLAFLMARLTHNWTVAPTAAFIGGISGPVALATWLSDRTGIGRSIRPDVLFVVAVVGGGFGILLASLFESQSLVHLDAPRALTIALAEEVAKVAVPFAMCTVWAAYRPPEQAVALAVASAAGFAAFESMTYAMSAADESLDEARHLLFQRSLITPFGHLPWTVIAVSVAATQWQRRGRLVFGPKALWGLVLAIALHTAWNSEVGKGGWWVVAAAANGAVSFAVFIFCIRGLRYDGPYAAPPRPPSAVRDRQ